MPIRFVPTDEAEIQKLKEIVPNADRKTLEEVRKRLGFRNIKTMLVSLYDTLGISRQCPSTHPDLAKLAEPQIEVKIITPEIKEYIPKAVGKGDPETQVLVIGDDHAGEKTPSFDKKVYGKRFDVLFQSAMTITELHRNMYPLNDLVVIDVGDNVQGENPYQGSTIGTVECGAVEQIYDLALPTLTSFLFSLKQQFKSIKFYGVRGNHGRYSRVAPQTSNWDLALYKALAKAKLPEGIEIYYSDEFSKIVEIEGFRFFIFHSDQIRSAPFGIPYFALIRAVKDWYVTYGGFPYAICFPPDTKVLLSNGEMKAIQMVKTGEQVIGSNNQCWKVKHLIKRDYDGKLIELGIQGLPETLSCTPEHPILTRRKGRKGSGGHVALWTEAQHINIGDWVATPYPPMIVDNDELSVDWCNLVGIYLAEGFADEYQTSFGFNEGEDDLITEVKQLLFNLYGKVGNIYWDKKRHSKCLRICSKEIASDLRGAGDCLAWEKKLDAQYMLLPQSKQEAILRMWLKGDGDKRTDTLRGTTTSPILADQLTIIGRRLGYYVSVLIKPERKGHRQSFYLAFSYRKLKRYSREWHKVKRIEYRDYQGDVYNLEVTGRKGQGYNYTANSIIVHNCGHWHKEDFLRVTSETKLLINGALVTDDPFTLEQIKTSTIPNHWTFGVHRRKGISWLYSLIVDNKFLPHKQGTMEDMLK